MKKMMITMVAALAVCLGASQARASRVYNYYGGVYNLGDDEFLNEDGITIGVYADADGVAAVVNLWSQVLSPNYLDIHGPGTVNMYDGPVGYYNGGPMANDIDAYDNCTINIYSARASSGAHAWENSTINVYGGAGCYNFEASGTGTVNIYGSDFAVDGSPVSLPFTVPTGLTGAAVTGTLADGTTWTQEGMQGWVYAEENGIIRLLPSQPMEVAIDIKPGSYPNTINLGSNGVVPVAILSSADFDATTVNPETITLAGAGVAVRGKGSKYLAAFEDVDGDGILDLVAHVLTDNLDRNTFQAGYALLNGTTFDGQAIEGWDEITIVPAQ